jgi:hypothetical protein
MARKHKKTCRPKTAGQKFPAVTANETFAAAFPTSLDRIKGRKPQTWEILSSQPSLVHKPFRDVLFRDVS